MSDQNVVEFVSKRIERLNAFEKMAGVISSDLRELKYQVTQYDAKVQNFERQILAKKEEIKDLDEKIRQKKIEVSGSMNNLRDSLNARELALTKEKAELHVAQQNVKERARVAEELIVKAELAIGHRPEERAIPVVAPAAVAKIEVKPIPLVEKRGPGRPPKSKETVTV